MERLATCCKVLYDIDVIDKQCQIVKLKKEIIKTPKILFDNDVDFRTKKDQIFNNIKEGCDLCILDNQWYDLFKDLDVDSNHTLSKIISDELKKITNNEHNDWCFNISSNILDGISSIIQSLFKINKFEDFTINELNNFIFEYIVFMLDDENDGFLLKMAIYKCKKCDKIDDYNNNGLCFECFEFKNEWFEQFEKVLNELSNNN